MHSEFKPVKLRLKIDLVSYPAWAERLGKYDNMTSDGSVKLLFNRGGRNKKII